MKIAILRYRERVAPRYGFSEDVLIVDLVGREARDQEVIPLRGWFPYEIPKLLKEKGVEVVIAGGINRVFQEMFRSFGIEVVWGFIGTPEEALAAFSVRGADGWRVPCGRRRARRRLGQRNGSFRKEVK